MDILTVSISQGFLWALMAIGVYLTFRILNIADLTAEGSFPLGAGVSVVLIVNGMNPFLATLIAIGAGMIAGLVTGMLYTKFKIPALLSGILTMTALYSINLRIMGANISLGSNETIFQMIGISKDWAPLIIGIICTIIVVVLLYVFFNTELGFVIRATGDNEQMVRAQGVNTNFTKIIGLMISNGIIAFSGALLAQDGGSANISMGVGTIVIGLASVIIGEVLFDNLTIAKRLLCVALGSIVYRMIIALVLNLGLEPTDLKLISAIVLAIALSSPTWKGLFQKSVGKRGLVK